MITNKQNYQLPTVAKYGHSDIESILGFLEKAGDFSDVYLSTERKITIKVNGEPFLISGRALGHDEVSGFLNHLTRDETANLHVAKGHDIDESCSIPSGKRGEYYRYRINASSFTVPDKGRGCNMTLRKITPEPPTIKQINLDPKIAEALMPEQGLVLVCGPTGSGKSTTLAASIKHRAINDEINEDGTFVKKGLVILTYEDPIEYIHNYECANGTTIYQSSVGPRGDVKTFKQGLKNALRRAPNLIFVGELRDEESVDIAIQICNTAHTCISSLHASDTGSVFERLASYYPAAMQAPKILQILQSIKVCLVQGLYPKVGGGRVMIKEYLEFTENVIESINLGIKTNGIDNLKQVIDENVNRYGISLKSSATEALENGLITELTYRIIVNEKLDDE
jgi:defect-in-organelle-trafficking protein DotB